jgi:hypothetical protein
VSFDFIIAPNPCTDYFYLFADEELPFNLVAYNLTGEQVLFQEVRDNISTIDVSGLSKGLYIIKINGNARKIIIN